MQLGYGKPVRTDKAKAISVEWNVNMADKTVVLSFGRLNPPTTGHQKLVDKIKSTAKKMRADAYLYMSHTSDPKKNPLSYDDKVRFAKKAFGPIVKKSSARTIIQALQELDGQYDNAVIVVGSDRVTEFKSLLMKYNGKDYNYDSIQIISAGERDPDAEDVTGMSASKLRDLAKKGNYEEFKKGVPPKLSERDTKQLYDKIRGGMNITEETVEEALSFQQRMQRRIMMRRIKNKIARGRRIAQRRKASPEKLKVRAQRQARQVVRKKLAGSRGAAYKDLPMSARQQIDKKVEKKKALISRLAKRLLPKVRKSESERLKRRLTKEENLYGVIQDVLELVERNNLSESVRRNLEKKSEKYGVDYDLIEAKFVDCKLAYNKDKTTLSEEQWAFNRLNMILANEQREIIREAIDYHLENQIPFSENIFRMASQNYFRLYTEAKKMYDKGELIVEDSFDQELLESDIGEFGLYEGESVPLDMPMLELDEEEEKKELNKPKRGGPKKFYVYVKDPSTGNIKKVTFGDTTGLKAKIDDPAARKSFAARHKCSQQKDKTKPGYWACRLPYYAKQLGLSGGGNFFW